MDKIKLHEISYLQYSLGLESSWKSPLSDFLISKKSRIFVLSENDKPVSYSIVTERNRMAVVLYLFTSEDKRNKGYATRLIKELRTFFGCYILTEVNADQPYFKALKKCFMKNGSKSFTSSRIFQFEFTEENRESHKKKHLERIPAYLRKKGFECISFSCMPPEIEKQLKESAHNEFRNNFDIAGFFEANEHIIDRDLSMVLVKDGKLRAYVLVSRLSESSICIEHIAESFSDIGSGIIAVPDICFIDAVVNNKEIKSGRYTVSVNNKRSNAFVDTMNLFWNEQIIDVISFILKN